MFLSRHLCVPLMSSDFKAIAFSGSFKNRILLKSMTRVSRQSSVSHDTFLISYVIYRFVNIDRYRFITTDLSILIR